MGKVRSAACMTLCVGLMSLAACGTVHDVNTTSTDEGSCSTNYVDIKRASLKEGTLRFTSSQQPHSAIRVDIVTDKGKASVIGSLPDSDSGAAGITADGRRVALQDSGSTSKPLDIGGAEMTTTAEIKQLGLEGSLKSLTFSRLDSTTGQQTGDGCTMHIN